MSKKGFFSISIFCFVFFASNVYAKSSELDFKEGELLVKFAPKSDGKQKTLNENRQYLDETTYNDYTKILNSLKNRWQQ